MREFKLPEIGEGVVEGEIVRWLKAPGDAVQANEALVEVMTDKATIEIPAPFGGRMIEHRAAEGDICPVGSVIAMLDVSGAATAAPPAAVAAQQNGSAAHAPRSTPAAAQGGPRAPIPATPAARSLARSEGIGLDEIPLGERGRITKVDVQQAAHERAARPATASAPVSAPPSALLASSSAPSGAVAARPRPSADLSDRADEYVPFRGLRRVIAEGLSRSYNTAVHYTYVEQVDVSKLVELRNTLKDAAADVGVSLSFLPFIARAVLAALKTWPMVNATLDEANQRIVLKRRYHLGIAAATPNGLMVPVVKDADTLSLLDLAREITLVGEAAKAGTATRDELSGSTFTISSLGTIGGVLATPIINFPEVGVLGVHAIRKQPVVTDDDRIVIGHVMNLSVSLDHRVVDGYEGARFMQDIKAHLERPGLLVLS